MMVNIEMVSPKICLNKSKTKRPIFLPKVAIGVVQFLEIKKVSEEQGDKFKTPIDD